MPPPRVRAYLQLSKPGFGDRVWNSHSVRTLTRPILLAMALLCLLSAPAVRAQATQEIRPPFGLKWMENTERMTSLLRATQANITQKRMLNGREAWTVEGISQPGLKRTIFYFTDSALVEVELQYEHAQWDANKYDAFLEEVRQRIESKFGPGTPLAQQTTPKGEVTQKVVGYSWAQELADLQLFYYSAERGAMAYRTVSLHYRAH